MSRKVMATDVFPDQPTLPESVICLGNIEWHPSSPPPGVNVLLQKLRHPVWPESTGPSIFDIVQPGKTVCFVVSDQTRKTGVHILLPPLLAALAEKGCRADDMCLLIATGIHRAPVCQELKAILGEDLYKSFKERIFIHDCDDEQALRPVGVTSRGNRVHVNRRAVEADVLVPIGAATYHYHAGFGGGRKSLVPGLAGRETIAWNHSLTLDPNANRIRPGVEPGRLEGNAVADEMLEAARLCRPDIIINTVLSPDGEIIDVFSGDLDAAHRAACELVEHEYRAEIPEAADFVIASAAGTSNWVQAHKALYNASRAVGDKGSIILFAPCAEGIGDASLRSWLDTKDLPTLYEKLRCAPEIYGQTALSTKLRAGQTILVTEMTPDELRTLTMESAPTITEAIDRVVSRLSGLRRRPTCYWFPHARFMVPFRETETLER